MWENGFESLLNACDQWFFSLVRQDMELIHEVNALIDRVLERLQ